MHFISTTSVFIFETSRLDKKVVKQANAKVEDAISVNGVYLLRLFVFRGYNKAFSGKEKSSAMINRKAASGNCTSESIVCISLRILYIHVYLVYIWTALWLQL